jgi:hypothetical protein
MALALTTCAPHREAGPQRAAWQRPIEPACDEAAATLSSTGLTVATSFERESRARSRITNRGDRTRIVSPQTVSLCAGPCAGSFAECERRRDWESGPAYAVTLAPGETLELAIDATHPDAKTSCEKLGLIGILDVDDTRACVELGRWIVSAP